MIAFFGHSTFCSPTKDNGIQIWTAYSHGAILDSLFPLHIQCFITNIRLVDPTLPQSVENPAHQLENPLHFLGALLLCYLVQPPDPAWHARRWHSVRIQLLYWAINCGICWVTVIAIVVIVRYFVWDAMNSIYYSKYFGPGFAIHGTACSFVFLFALVRLINYDLCCSARFWCHSPVTSCSSNSARLSWTFTGLWYFWLAYVRIK